MHSPSTMILLPRLSKQVMRRSTSELLGIDLRLLMVLSYLSDHEEMPQHELADALCVDASNVVLILNELEDAGYVTRRRDREDRRRHRVSITATGRDAFEHAQAAQRAIEDEVLQGLDAAERETFWKLLCRAVRGVEPGAAEAVEPGAAELSPAAA